MIHKHILRNKSGYFILISAAIIWFVFGLYGCTRTYYPAIRRSSPPPMIFPTNSEMPLDNAYIGADYTYAKGDYDNEFTNFFRLNYGSALTRAHTNLSMELYGYGGTYKVSGLDIDHPAFHYDGVKELYGFGGALQAGYNFTTEDFIIGVGISLNLAGEFGEYYNFRRSAERDGVIENAGGMLQMMPALFPYFSYHLSDHSVISGQLFLGLPGGYSPTFMYNYKGNIFWFAVFPMDQGNDDYPDMRMTLGLRFNTSNF
jgi:hypothetical protein